MHMAEHSLILGTTHDSSLLKEVFFEQFQVCLTPPKISHSEMQSQAP